MEIELYFAWVPGHCNIQFNEMADKAAKEGALLIPEEEESKIKLETSIKMIRKIIVDEWQNAWNRATVGSFTKNLIPTVDKTVKLPMDRHTGITYIRCLLNNGQVAANRFRMGFSESPMCECGEDEETIEHVLMFCNRYNVDRILFNIKLVIIDGTWRLYYIQKGTSLER